MQPRFPFKTALFCLLPITVLVMFILAPAVTSAPELTISNWVSTEPLLQGLTFHDAVSQGNRLYVSGGAQRNVEPVDSVQVVTMTSAGALGKWSSTRQLPAKRYVHAMAATNQFLYVIGGWDGQRNQNTVWRGVLDSNGIVSQWVDDRAYPNGVHLHEAVVVQSGNNQYLYVLGGFDASNTATTKVRYAKIEADGTLGNWNDDSAPDLPGPALYRTAAVAYGQSIYVTGGYNGSSASNAIYFASVNPDGTLSSWQNLASASSPSARYYHEAVVAGGSLVILGGFDGQKELSDVQAAPINNNGTLGTWAPQPNLPTTLQRFAATVTRQGNNDIIHVLGGQTSSTPESNTVYVSIAPLPTATPTATSTFVPTAPPTPTPGIAITLTHAPTGVVSLGDRITYTIDYHNRGTETLSKVVITNPVPLYYVGTSPQGLKPKKVEISNDGKVEEDSIRWEIGELRPNTQAKVSYTIKLPGKISASPSTGTKHIQISKSGPDWVRAGEPFNYTLLITNIATTTISIAQVEDELHQIDIAEFLKGEQLPSKDEWKITGTFTAKNQPSKVTGIVTKKPSGTGSGHMERAEWDLNQIKLAPDEAISLSFPITSSTALTTFAVITNRHYAVSFTLNEQGEEQAIGQTVVETLICPVAFCPANAPPPVVIVVNPGATVSWDDQKGQHFSNRSAHVLNTPIVYYFPFIPREAQLK